MGELEDALAGSASASACGKPTIILWCAQVFSLHRACIFTSTSSPFNMVELSSLSEGFQFSVVWKIACLYFDFFFFF